MNLWREIWRVICQVEVSHDVEATLKVGWRKILILMLWLIRYIGWKLCWSFYGILEWLFFVLWFFCLTWHTTWMLEKVLNCSLYCFRHCLIQKMGEWREGALLMLVLRANLHYAKWSYVKWENADNINISLFLLVN